MQKSSDRRSVAYLSLEAPREGVASYVHVTEIIAGLQRRGWTVDLYSFGYGWQRLSLPFRMVAHVGLQIRLIAKIFRYRYVYVRAHPLAYPAATLAKWLGRVVVHEVNGTWDDIFIAHPLGRFLRQFIEYLQRAQFRAASGLIAVTPQLENWLRRQTAPSVPPVAVISNGANIDLFSPDATTRQALPRRYAVFFGGLTLWHGVDTMLAALSSAEWPNDVSLVVVGDGPEMERLRAHAATDRRLVLLGRQPYREIGGIVAGAIAGLVPIGDPNGRSLSSGLAPLKLFETLACGVPAIVSDLPFQSGLIRDNDIGLVVPVDDGPALASAVAQLSRNPELARQMGERARTFAVAEHSWDRRADDTAHFMERIAASTAPTNNIDRRTVESFGHEWTTFKQSDDELSKHEREIIFDKYFGIFPWPQLKPDSVGMDIGCGSGRFAVEVAPRVGHLHAVDVSADALSTARVNLADYRNVSFHEASVAELPVPDGSLDFAYSLGVLHHVPDTQAAIQSVASKMKPGAPFLIYLYYALDNRPAWYRILWRISDPVRILISALPRFMRYAASQMIAVSVYWPLARLAAVMDKLSILPKSMPLSFYRHSPFYVMRTDAYDRFCTPLEQRFSKVEIEAMLTAAGFGNVRFSDGEPFWCAVSTRNA